jgi:hypothetical protein
MSVEEYSEKLLELTKKEIKAKRCYLEAKLAVINLKKEHCYSLVEQFKPKIGKKVVVHYKDYMGEEKTSKPGFLKEFKWYSGVAFVEDGLYPVLTKPKQDGSMSNREFPEYDNTRAEITKIIDIEEIL